MKLLLACIAALLLSAPANANDGYVQGADGFWYSNGVAHVRTFVAGYYYYQSGCRYWYPGYYTYAKVEVAKTPANWREKLLDIKREQVEQQNYLDSLKFLGLDSPAYPRLSGYGSVQIGNYGANGNTIYGVASLSELYGTDFLGVGLQQYNRGLDRIQDLHGSSLAGLAQLLQTEGANRAKVAELVALGQLLQTMRQTSESKAEFKFKFGPEGKVEVLPEPKGDTFKAWNAQAQQCAACHFGSKENLKGGFDISTWPALPTEKKMELAVKHLLTKDEAKRMPRTADGKAGPALKEDDVLSLWLKVTAK